MKKVFFLILSFFFITISNASIIDVPSYQPTIQAGINIAANGDTVLVQPGTYFENINYIGKNITVASLFFTTQDSIYIDQTIIDGNQNGSVITYTNAENSTAVLTGFSIIHGNGTYCNPASLGNFNWGGGIFCLDSDPTLSYLKIWENQADFGGGISLINSNSILHNLIINNNHTSFGGAGLSCGLSSNPEIDNLKVLGNVANNGTGGMHFFYNSNAIVSNSIISSNVNQSSSACGGGISCVSASPIFSSLIVTDNSASSGGGFDLGDSNAILENVLISNNHCLHCGPGLWISNSTPVIINSTIANNFSDATSSNIYCVDNVNLTLLNSISWSEQYCEIWFYWDNLPSTVNIAYSDMKNGIFGVNTNNNGTINWMDGNIDLDPLFFNPDAFDFHLQDISHCIGAGINNYNINGMIYFAPEYDLDGNPRPNPTGSLPDIGAYENQFGEPQVSVDNVITPNLQINLSNFPNPFNPSTTITFDLATKDAKNAKIEIYNLKGQKVKIIPIYPSTDLPINSVTWNGTDNYNQPVSSGVYFYQLKNSGKTIAQNKCLLLK